MANYHRVGSYADVIGRPWLEQWILSCEVLLCGMLCLQCLAGKGEIEEAITCLKKALKLEPETKVCQICNYLQKIQTVKIGLKEEKDFNKFELRSAN